MDADQTNAIGEIAERMTGIILKEALKHAKAIRMLAHYTSLDAFASILRSKEMWFSCVRDMNDTSEISEGFDCVAAALAEHGPRIFDTDKVPYAAMEIDTQFAARREILEAETYALCLSEHGSDRQTDRLVMWRAYGQDGHGLCVVLRKDSLLGQTAKGRFPVHWSPITYESRSQLSARVERNLRQVEKVFRSLPQCVSKIPAQILGVLVASFAVPLVLRHKNVAFADEREVRFLRSPLLQPLVLADTSSYRTLGAPDVPKNIFVLPLRNYPEFGGNAELPQLVDHVVIGPSHRQEEMRRDVRSLLDAHNLSHAPIRLSEIPYRANKAALPLLHV